MVKVLVIYASLYGHTKVLAEAVAEGARQVAGAEVVLKDADDVTPDELKEADAIIWGSSGIFGEPNPKMANLLTKLGGLWASGALQGKVGGVFGTTSTPHGGVENLMRALQTPMQHLGMIIVSNTGPLTPERIQYGCPYGAVAVIPVEASKDAPMNKPNDAEMAIAREHGRRIAEVARRLAQAPQTA